MTLALLGLLTICRVAGSSEIESTDTAEETVPPEIPQITLATTDSGVYTITFGPTAISLVYGYEENNKFTITNSTDRKIGVIAETTGSKFGLIGEKTDSLKAWTSSSPEMMLVGFSIAPGESVTRTIVFDPSYGEAEDVASGSLSLDFVFGIPEIDDPSNDKIRGQHPEIHIELAGFGA